MDESGLPGWQCLVEENDDIQPGEVELIAAVLANHGVEAHQTTLSAVRRPHSRPILWVRDADYERALLLVREMRNAGENSPRGFPWRCGGCMEQNEPQFDICWNCGRDRPTGRP